MEKRLNEIKLIIKEQENAGYRVNNLNSIDMKWLIEQAEKAHKSLDKEIPQKVEKNEHSSQVCPVCKTNVNGKYCSFCGQKISYGY